MIQKLIQSKAESDVGIRPKETLADAELPATRAETSVPAGTEATGSSAKGVHPSLSLRGISKSFPGVLANDNIDLDVFGGEVQAILGENGAGKTTLMKIL